MPSAPHLYLSPKYWELLVALSDPEKAVPNITDTSEKHINSLLNAAREHGVIEIVGRKLTPWYKNNGLEHAVALLAHERQQLIAKTMLLDHHGKALSDIFGQLGIRSQIIKGPSFSGLYKNRDDRVYSDIDFLVEIDDIGRANRVAQEYGLVIGDKQLAAAEHTLEYQWRLQTPTLNILIEIQADLVHSPSLRRHVRYGYREHLATDQFEVSPTVKLLLTAIMHTACSHKFGMLRPLVDVLQACRKLTPLDDIGLKLVVQELQYELEVGTTASLVAKIFDDAHAYRIASLFESLPQVKTSNLLITPETVYACRHNRWPLRAGLSRSLFRIMQKSRKLHSLLAWSAK